MRCQKRLALALEKDVTTAVPSPLRVLFLCAHKQSGPEYAGRRRNAEALDPNVIDSFFVWQRHLQQPEKDTPALLTRMDRNYFLDFGRDMTITPRVNRLGRALMMARRVAPAFFRIRRIVKRERIEVVYTSQQWLDVLLGRMLARTCLVEHTIHVHFPVTSLGPGTQHAIRTTRIVYSISDFVKNTAIACGTPASSLRTIYNSVDLERFDGVRCEGGLREEFRWPADAKVVLAVGRLDPEKGHIDLLRAFAKLTADVSEARLLLCGETTLRYDYASELRHAAEQLAVSDRVVFAGTRVDIPRLMSSSDVFCLPTYAEGFGNVFAEALASATPVIAWATGGVPEVVRDGVTGILCDPGDVDALAAALLLILRDRTLAEEVGAAGRADAITRFDPGVIARRWSILMVDDLRGRRKDLGPRDSKP